MNKLVMMLAVLLVISGCSAAKEKAACTLTGGNNTVAITEGRDIASDKDGQILHVKQTFQIDSEEADVLVIYREYYEKELAAFAADEKMKTSLTETETGFLVTFEFDVKNISASSSDKMLKMLDAQSLNAEQLLNQMKEDGFKCGEEEEADSSTTPETDANKNAESK